HVDLVVHHAEVFSAELDRKGMGFRRCIRVKSRHPSSTVEYPDTAFLIDVEPPYVVQFPWPLALSPIHAKKLTVEREVLDVPISSIQHDNGSIRHEGRVLNSPDHLVAVPLPHTQKHYWDCFPKPRSQRG